MHICVCELCWFGMKPLPKIIRRFTKVNEDLKCYECGVEPATLYVEVKK
jgi:hypothetical protein